MDFVTILEENIRNIIVGFVDAIPEIVISVIVLICTWGLTKIQMRFMPQILKKIRFKPVLADFLSTLISGFIWISGILISCGILFPSITPGKILTALGLGSIAVGFAFKDIFENFIAGVLIILREPFKIGDIIEVDNVDGIVITISVRDTVIHDLNQEKIVIPNAMIFKNKVRVFTAFEKRRASAICGIAYKEDIETAKQCIMKALDGLDTISKDHKVEIKVVKFNDSSVDIQILWFTDSRPAEIRHSKDQVLTAIKKALDTEGIEIPFPYRTLVFQNELCLKNTENKP